MDKSKFHLNPDAEIVKNIREGLKRTGGYCPCRTSRRISAFAKSSKNSWPTQTTMGRATVGCT